MADWNSILQKTPPPTPPAIVQQAKNCAYYLGLLHKNAENQGKILLEWKQSGTWKEQFKTWGAACEHAVDLSRSQVNKLIAASKVETAHNAPLSNASASSSKVDEKAKDPPEKPAVQAATPEQMKPKPHSENGKPKHLLAIWRELEESHFGRALNRIDELNRQCPNAKFHVELIAADKRCLSILEQWKQQITHA